MNNLDLYNKVRTVPPEAQREIKGGRLNGKTDINPMWRIKTLTEQFGVCGFGWKYEITDKRIVESDQSGETAAFVDINLYVQLDGKWSEAIPGTGGSMFVEGEKNGLHTSDECFKMALTDAISVACKALGVGADIYYAKDSTKYDRSKAQPSAPSPAKVNETPFPQEQSAPPEPQQTVRQKQVAYLLRDTKYTLETADKLAFKYYAKPTIDDLTAAEFNELYNRLSQTVKDNRGAGNG